MTELTDQELLYASPEDWDFYNKIIEGLPTMAGKNGDGKDKFGSISLTILGRIYLGISGM